VARVCSQAKATTAIIARMRSTARNIPIRIAFSLLKNFSIWLLDGSELGAKNISPSKEITIQISSGEA
jgi:hypothetical protein